jgi:peptidoglycan/LPS O-acetylase OafA/YrhL
MEGQMFSDFDSESGHSDFESRYSPAAWYNTASNYSKGFQIPTWSTAAARIGCALVPSFLQRRSGREEKLHPSAYLDGMRGLAALFVFFCHYFYTAFVIAEGWAMTETFEFARLPFIRLLYAGPSAVCVFFIISGYALSLKPLKQARSQSFEGFSKTMSSMIFRRFFRLYLPTFASTLLIITLIRMGFYDMIREFATDRTYMRNLAEPHAVREETLGKQVSLWAWEMFRMIQIWSWDDGQGRTDLDPHLWTIPVEFRCSMILFLVTLGTARLRTHFRFLCMGAITWFVLRSDRWDLTLFLAGNLLAELDLIRGAHDRSARDNSDSVLPSSESDSAKRTNRMRWLWVFLSIVALFLMSSPDEGPHNSPGLIWLGTLIPEWFTFKYRFWQMMGAILFVAAAARVPWWQRFFNHPAIQYLGRISYAIYLMHGPVLHTIGYPIERWAWGVTGIEGVNFKLGFALASLFNIPLVIWASDLFMRAVDIPSVKFARWLESKLTVDG